MASLFNIDHSPEPRKISEGRTRSKDGARVSTYSTPRSLQGLHLPVLANSSAR